MSVVVGFLVPAVPLTPEEVEAERRWSTIKRVPDLTAPVYAEVLACDECGALYVDSVLAGGVSHYHPERDDY